jgi:hypothetical protein
VEGLVGRKYGEENGRGDAVCIVSKLRGAVDFVSLWLRLWRLGWSSREATTLLAQHARACDIAGAGRGSYVRPSAMKLNMLVPAWSADFVVQCRNGKDSSVRQRLRG